MTALELSISGGTTKDGQPEPVPEVAVRAGEIVALVGPTGSGKTRLLADVERLAIGDSPTGRRVKLTGQPKPRSDAPNLVARISQSMSFFLDATAEELLRIHGEYRGHVDPRARAQEALEWANRISGEAFDGGTPLAQLSGGQARAFMVADTVIVSACPVVLIDEIENAGIDRTLALRFLLEHQSIAILATHDPLIALQAQRRIVMENGGMTHLIQRTPAELELLDQLSAQQRDREALQQRLRSGLLLADWPGSGSQPPKSTSQDSSSSK
jgi:ABC-type lipoprotein export system ATPase subunit